MSERIYIYYSEKNKKIYFLFCKKKVKKQKKVKSAKKLQPLGYLASKTRQKSIFTIKNKP